MVFVLSMKPGTTPFGAAPVSINPMESGVDYRNADAVTFNSALLVGVLLRRYRSANAVK